MIGSVFIANQVEAGSIPTVAIQIAFLASGLSETSFCAAGAEPQLATYVQGDVSDDGGLCFAVDCDDVDGDGIPDACDASICAADFNGDEIVDGVDLAVCLLYTSPSPRD